MHAQSQRAHGTVRRTADFLLSDTVFWAAMWLIGVSSLFGILHVSTHTLLAMAILMLAIIGTRVSK